MPFATTHTVSLHGAQGHLIDVQSDVSPGQVGVTLVGRPDTSLNEARDRCRMAAAQLAGWAGRGPSASPSCCRRPTCSRAAPTSTWPSPCPCWPPPATCRRPPSTRTAFVGELTLAGDLRCVAGVLPMVLAAAARGITRVFVPEPQADEAAMVPGMSVIGMRSLAQVVAELRGDEVPTAAPVAPLSGSRLLSWRGQERREEVDLADLVGMADTRFAVEVAAAGGHHLLLTGPKGAGKTSIAERIPTILPDLTTEESLELTAIHSLAGALDPGDGHADAPTVLGAAPRREQGEHRRRRQRPGDARRDQPRALAGCCSSTSSRCSAPT